jgi:hypothetical protein
VPHIAFWQSLACARSPYQNTHRLCYTKLCLCKQSPVPLHELQTAIHCVGAILLPPRPIRQHNINGCRTLDMASHANGLSAESCSAAPQNQHSSTAHLQATTKAHSCMRCATYMMLPHSPCICVMSAACAQQNRKAGNYSHTTAQVHAVALAATHNPASMTACTGQPHPHGIHARGATLQLPLLWSEMRTAMRQTRVR